MNNDGNPGAMSGIISIAIGGLSLLLIWLKFLFVLLGIFFMIVNIIGIVLAVSSRKKCENSGYSTTPPTIGLILNIISLIIFTLGFTACTALVWLASVPYLG